MERGSEARAGLVRHAIVDPETERQGDGGGADPPCGGAAGDDSVEQHICPVWAMLKASTRIEASFRIEGAGAHAM